MADKILRTRLSLRRAKETEYDPEFTPLNGEILFVDTNNGLKQKVGNGINTFSELPYESYGTDDVILGYYWTDGEFYSEPTYIDENKLEKVTTKIYIDQNSWSIYIYASNKYKCIDEMIPTATDKVAGLSKLYKTEGMNEDGSLTQKAITESINKVHFSIDSSDQECLLLDKPW